jgi:hypothetical protein
MATFTIISLLVGAVLGLRFKVLILVPAIILSLLITVGTGVAHGHNGQSIRDLASRFLMVHRLR